MLSMWLCCNYIEWLEETCWKKTWRWRYPCPECKFTASTASYLKKHVKNKHKWLRYPCPECKFTAFRASYLKKHLKNKHKWLRYPCPECKFTASRASYLKKHLKNKHKWLRYPWVCFTYLRRLIINTNLYHLSLFKKLSS